MPRVKVVRNRDGIWVNTKPFSESSKFFEKHGYYDASPINSPTWIDFWKREMKRSLHGYTIGGVKITGDHYFFLNYSPMLKAEMKSGNSARKVEGFPDFRDADYTYFWSREIARNGVFSYIPAKKHKYIINLKKRDLEAYYDKLEQYFKELRLMVEIDKQFLGGGEYDLVVGKARRQGFEQPYSEKIKTPNGETTMGDIKVGDYVLTPDGSKAKVLEKYEQGIKDIYEVELYDGRKVTCGKDHLWEVYSQIYRKGKRKREILKTEELIKRGFTKKRGTVFKYLIKINSLIEYKEKELPIPPYTLGALLGDGGIIKQSRISSVTDEIPNLIIKDLNNNCKYFTKYGRYRVTKGKEGLWYTIKFELYDRNMLSHLRKITNTSKFANNVNPLFQKLKELKVNIHGDYKFIPDIYKTSSKKQRLELVKGLMDTDGYISKEGDISFNSSSKKLVEDLQDVLYSLGIPSTMRKRRTDRTYILYIGSNLNLFKLKFKKDRHKSKRRRTYIPIKNIKKLDKKEMSACILIDSPEHLYLTNRYITTHNSYKAAAISAKNWALIPNSKTILAAYSYDYLLKGGLYTKARNVISFLREHTAWGHPSDTIDSSSKGIIEASYKEMVDGRSVKKGFKSLIRSVTYNSSTDVTRGADVYDIFFEESGAAGQPGRLHKTIAATYETVRAGSLKTGLITVFGTSGNLDASSKDYSEIMLNPLKYGFLPFRNIWDEGEYDNYVGFFQPVSWAMEGFYDEQGNSDIKGAEAYEKAIRKRMIESGATSQEINDRMMEKPLTPLEAFGSAQDSFFPVKELRRQLRKVEANKLNKLKGIPVEMYYENGELVVMPILNNKCIPITKYKGKIINSRGCPVIYEFPVENAPRNSYKIGYDPVAQDEGSSFAAIIVYKSVIQGSDTHDVIVAEYIGRPNLAQDADRIAEMFADLYNSQIMHENMDKGTRTYFRRIKRLNLLAAQPDAVINNNVKNSRVARVYGCHMNKELKAAGKRYTKEWLLATNNYDEFGNPIKNYELITSTRLLEELIYYDDNGNFDLVSALFMALFMVQEQVLPDAIEKRDKYVEQRFNEFKSLIEDY